MAINPIMMSALKALSYADIDITKTYKVERIMDNLTQPLLKLNYNILDQLIEREGYQIPVRLFEPDERTSDSVLLFFHGGGWVTGNIDTYIRPCAQLANQTGCRVASVDYRLAPEYPFPYAIEDCYYVAREFFSHSYALGIEPENIVLVGDSAGGNIAAVVSLMARDRAEFTPQRQILIYPLTDNDHSETSPHLSVQDNGYDYLLTSKKIREYISLYIQNPDDMQNPYFAPMLAENLECQPRTLIITAQFDPLRDEGEAYGEKLRAFGNDVKIHRLDDALHGCFVLPVKFSVVKEIHDVILEFLREGIDSDQ